MHDLPTEGEGEKNERNQRASDVPPSFPIEDCFSESLSSQTSSRGSQKSLSTYLAAERFTSFRFPSVPQLSSHPSHNWMKTLFQKKKRAFSNDSLQLNRSRGISWTGKWLTRETVSDRTWWCSLLHSHFLLPARPTAIGSCISQIYVESFPEGTSCPNKEERTATGSALIKRFVTMCSAMNAFAEEPGVLDEWWNNAFNKRAWWGSWRREHIFPYE